MSWKQERIIQFLLNRRFIVSNKMHDSQNYCPIQAYTGKFVEEYAPNVSIFNSEIRKGPGHIKRGSGCFLQEGGDLRGAAKGYSFKHSFPMVGKR